MTIIEQLKRDEGFRAQPYRDSEGHWTVGYGINLEATPISREVAEAWLRERVAVAAKNIETAFPWAAGLSEARYGVLLNMVYNLGLGGVLTFERMLHALREHRYEDAARELLDSRYARQVGPRADRLASQLRENRWV